MVLETARTLAEGHPVSVATLAQRCAVSESQVAHTLAVWPGVFQDEDANVVGFWGLALGEMAYRYTVGGRQLYTWCAWDTLFIGEEDVGHRRPGGGASRGSRRGCCLVPLTE